MERGLCGTRDGCEGRWHFSGWRVRCVGLRMAVRGSGASPVESALCVLAGLSQLLLHGLALIETDTSMQTGNYKKAECSLHFRMAILSNRPDLYV